MATNGQTYILLNYLQQNREYDSLTIEKESITFDGKTINLEGFDVEKFLSENKNFVRDVSSLPMDDVFNIIKIHVDYSNVLRKQEEKNKQEEEEKARQEMEALIYSNPSFAKFQIFNNIDSLDYKKSFLKYSDDRGENFVFQDVTPKTFMDVYHSLEQPNKQITEDEIFKALAGKFVQIPLENRFTAERRYGVSEEHISNLRRLEEQNNEHMENHNIVVGNEEFGIYINNGRVITMGYNRQGNRVVENHSNANLDSQKDDLNDDLICSYDVQQLISFEEYKDIIVNRDSLSNDERTKVDNFENFLFSVMAYKDYLTPELYEVYESFSKLWDYLESVKETTTVIEDAKYRYRDMQERSEQIELTNAKNKVTILTRQLDNTSNYGYINALLYVGAVLFVGIVIAVITVLAK